MINEKYGFDPLKISRIWFSNEKKPYRVRAASDRFIICTKPYNFIPETVMYTIVDLEEEMRGTDSYVFSPYSYWSDEDCINALNDLENERMWLTRHNRVSLNEVRIVKTK